ncbi:MAG: hypothetical protein JO000_05680 [Alphaproteobacteria bacterium]|nr:hypothetical protein [Alphaproteobacteria bacterium]
MQFEPATQAFLVRSQERVIAEYKCLLATYPDMPPHERAAIERSLHEAAAWLDRYRGWGSGPDWHIAA